MIMWHLLCKEKVVMKKASNSQSFPHLIPMGCSGIDPANSWSHWSCVGSQKPKLPTSFLTSALSASFGQHQCTGSRMLTARASGHQPPAAHTQFPVIHAPRRDTTRSPAFNGKTQLYSAFAINCPILKKVTDMTWH